MEATSFQFESIIPAIFKLTGETWGIALHDISSLMVMLTALCGVTFLLMLVFVLGGIRGTELPFRAGLSAGVLLSVVGCVFSFLPSVDQGAVLFQTLGLLLLTGSIVFLTHKTYQSVC